MNEQNDITITEEFHNLGTSALVSAGAMFIAKTIRVIFLSIVNIILINLLRPEDFGSVKYVVIIVGIAALINEMGVSTAIVQKEKFSENYLFPLFLFTILWGFFIYIIIFVLAPTISTFFNAPELTNLFRIGTLIIPLLSISAVHRAYLRRNMRFVKLATIETIATLLSSILSVTLAVIGGGPWAILGGYLLFEAIKTLILVIIQKIPLSNLTNFKNILPIIYWGGGVVIFNVIDYILSNAPYFIIGKLVGKEALGFFSVSMDLAFLPRVGINAISGLIIFSTFSRLQNDNIKTTIVFRKLVLLISIISIPFQLIMICMPEETLRLICFVKKNSVWLNTAPYLKWLSATAIIYNYTYFLNTIWISNGRLKSSSIVSLIMLVTITITIMIGFHYGLIGICKSILIRAIIIFPIYLYLNYLFVNIRVKLYLSTLLPSIAGGLVMGIYLIIIQSIFKTSSISATLIKFILSLISGSLLYLFTLRILFPDALTEVISMFKIPLKKSQMQ